MLPKFTCFGGGKSKSDRRKSSQESTDTPESDHLSPVLLELFASQGCATSPEAEAIATRLTRPDKDSSELPRVVVLAFHVDYWDHNGWKDPFASSAWTVRQKSYVEALRLDTLFTPQIVINGKTSCVGTDFDAVIESVKSASRSISPSLKLTFQKESDETITIAFNGKIKGGIQGRADLYMAVYENGLVTDVKLGEENGGFRVLGNDHVVRRLEKVVSFGGENEGKKVEKVEGSVNLRVWDGFNPAKTGILFFVQNAALQVLGVQQFQLPETISQKTNG